MKKFYLRTPAIRIVFFYIVFTGVWIYCSDMALNLLVEDKAQLLKVSVAKGFFFTFVTSIFLYVLVKREMAIRIETEQALQESKNHFQQLIDQSPLAEVVSGTDSTTLIFNQKFTELFGYTSQDIVQSSQWWNLAYPDEQYRNTIRTTWNALTNEVLLQKSVPKPMTATVTCKNGAEKFIEFHFSIIGVKLLITLTDLTKQKQIESALRESEEKYKSLVENSPDGIGIQINGIIQYLNITGARLLGVERVEDIIGKPIMDFVHSDYHEFVKGRIAKVVQFKEALPPAEEKFVRADGVCVDVEIQAMPVLYHNKEAIQFIIRDSTQRKKSEEELRLLAQSISSIKDYVSIIDFNNNLIFVNDAFLQSYGYTREEIMGKNVSYLLTPSVEKQFQQEIVAKTKTGGWYGEIVNRRKDGTEFPIEIWTSLVYDNAKRAVAMIGVARDVSERKLAEHTLQQSLERNNAIINAIPDLLFEVSDDGYILDYRCPSNLELFIPPEQFLGKKIDTILPPEIVQKITPAITQALQQNEIQVFEYTLTMHNELRYYEDRIVPLPDKKVLSVIRDITERKQTEDALRINERRMKKAQELAHVGNWEIDLITQTIWGSEESLRMYGYDTTIHRKPLSEIQKAAKEPYRTQLDSALKNLVNNNAPYDIQYEITRESDGELRFMHSKAEVVRDAHGVPISVIGVIQDITDIHKAEQTLLQSESSFRAIFNGVSDAIFLQSAHSHEILSVNEKAKEMFGYTDEEVHTLTAENLSAGYPPYTQREANEFFRSAEDGKIVTFEWLAKHRNNTTFWVEISIKKSLIGDVEYFLVLVRNIQERKHAEDEKQKLQQQLFQVQKAESIGTLAAGIAHDFNNILNIILANVELLALRYEANEKASERVSAVLKSIDRGSKLVRQLLTYARKNETKHEALNINDIVHDMGKFIFETFPKTLTTVTRLGQQLPLISADAIQLHQVLMNLCINARDAVEDNGVITLSTELCSGERVQKKFPGASSKHYILLKVADSGNGIEKEKLHRIFEPFFTTKKPGKGTGLGLAVTYGIIQSHKGFIDVESEIGKGTTFNLYFPVIESLPVQAETPQSLSAVPQGKNETVLLIEDESPLIELAASVLQTNGYSVISTLNGEDGIEMFKKQQHDISIVVSDLGLPKCNGIVVLKEIKKVQPNVKFILASGFISSNERTQGMENGAALIIDKPYNMRELLIKIRAVLDGEFQSSS